MISIREISDDKSSISSTRWAFASVVKVDIIIIVVTWLVGLVSNIIPQIPTLPNTFYGHVALLLGILTGYNRKEKRKGTLNEISYYKVDYKNFSSN